MYKTSCTIRHSFCNMARNKSVSTLLALFLPWWVSLMFVSCWTLHGLFSNRICSALHWLQHYSLTAYKQKLLPYSTTRGCSQTVPKQKLLCCSETVQKQGAVLFVGCSETWCCAVYGLFTTRLCCSRTVHKHKSKVLAHNSSTSEVHHMISPLKTTHISILTQNS